MAMLLDLASGAAQSAGPHSGGSNPEGHKKRIGRPPGSKNKRPRAPYNGGASLAGRPYQPPAKVGYDSDAVKAAEETLSAAKAVLEAMGVAANSVEAQLRGEAAGEGCCEVNRRCRRWG